MKKSAFGSPDTNDSVDDADSVVLTIRDMITCAGGGGRRTFKNPCAADVYETFDNDEASGGAPVQTHDSFYSTATSDISALKPFQLPSLSPSIAHPSAQPSSDTLFAGLETPSHASAARSDRQKGTPKNLRSRSTEHDAALSPMTAASENSAIKAGLDRDLMSFSIDHLDLEAPSMDKYDCIMDDGQERAITEVGTCTSPKGLLRPMSNWTGMSELRKGNSPKSKIFGRRGSNLDVMTELSIGVSATEEPAEQGSSGLSNSASAATESVGLNRSNLDTTNEVYNDVAATAREGEIPQTDTIGSIEANCMSNCGKEVDTALSKVCQPKRDEAASNLPRTPVNGDGGHYVGPCGSNSPVPAAINDCFSANEDPERRTEGTSSGRDASSHGNENSRSPAIKSQGGISHLLSALFQGSLSKTSTEDKDSSLPPSRTSDAENMVAVEVEHLGSMTSEEFGKLPSTRAVNANDSETTESRSILMGKRLRSTNVSKITDTEENTFRCNSLSKKKKCWIGAIVLSAIVFIVAISSIIAANNASASVNARAAVAGSTSSAPSASVSPSQIPSLAPSRSETPSRVPSTKPSLDPSIIPTKTPSLPPSFVASNNPSYPPSEMPSIGLSSSPTLAPLYMLSMLPSQVKSNNPSSKPTKPPSSTPTHIASAVPLQVISENPSSVASNFRTKSPTPAPRSSSPIIMPSSSPSSEIDAFASSLNLYAPSSTDDPLYRALEWGMAQTYPPSRQRIALATLYYGTDGENWLDQISFLSDDDECLWAIPYGTTVKGVRCSDDGEVSVISLAENGLSGEIPSALQMLTHMSMLWLNGNEISGSLPSQLGTLRYLSRLDLSDNAMRGTIPSEIGNLRYLEDINLGVNIFSGTIPSTLSNLPKLKTVWMDRNILTGNLTAVCSANPGVLMSADCEEVACPCCAFCCDTSGVCGGSS